ncbi:MAG: FFLEELY motif protein [Lysobacterales bacterium]
MKRQAERLRKALSDSHELASLLDVPGYPLSRLEYLQKWQRVRLAETYADLLDHPRFQAAGAFFLDELYGGLHFRERDQEVEKVLPVMLRTLREDMLVSLAEAFELQALSLELDMGMVEAMEEHGVERLDPRSYGEIYRSCGRVAAREQQIDLIRELGLALNELVHHRLVLMLIRVLRGPARAAGFGLLQGFLERGLQAFRAMGDGTEFVMTIWERETAIMQRLISGQADPLGPVAGQT